LACGGSDDVGFDEFAEFWLRRASTSASRASSHWIYAWAAGGRAAKTSGSSEEAVMPPEGIRGRSANG
jgi:hypothetical protein